MVVALMMATQRAGRVSAATATGGRSKETSGLVAPPLKNTMAESVPMSNSNWVNSSPVLAVWLCLVRHWTTVLKRRATTIMPSSGTCGTGMSSVPGTIRTSNTRMARTIQRQASRRRRLARCSVLSSVHTESTMARMMRDLCQLPFAIAVRQFAAVKLGVMCMSMSLRIPLLVAALCFGGAAQAVDLEKGKEINGTCAACHSDNGQGGKKGEYPRIAGQQGKYIESQLKNFRARTRVNIPMFPYTQERELSDQDIKDVSAFLAGIKLETRMPTYTGNEDALTRLKMAEAVMIIPRAEGDVKNGAAVYKDNCAHCHGKDGMGRSAFPMLVGQYTAYLKRQVELYLKGDRPHDDEGTKGVLNDLKPQDIDDVLAYLTTLQESAE